MCVCVGGGGGWGGKEEVQSIRYWIDESIYCIEFSISVLFPSMYSFNVTICATYSGRGLSGALGESGNIVLNEIVAC